MVVRSADQTCVRRSPLCVSVCVSRCALRLCPRRVWSDAELEPSQVENSAAKASHAQRPHAESDKRISARRHPRRPFRNLFLPSIPKAKRRLYHNVHTDKSSAAYSCATATSQSRRCTADPSCSLSTLQFHSHRLFLILVFFLTHSKHRQVRTSRPTQGPQVWRHASCGYHIPPPYRRRDCSHILRPLSVLYRFRDVAATIAG